MSDTEQRDQIIKVLENYPGITSRMDLSADSALVIDLVRATKPTQPVDSKVHDSVGIKTVDGDLEHKMLMLFHRMSVCAAAHQDKDAEWIDGQCVTPSTAAKEAVKLHAAHLQAAVKEAESRIEIKAKIEALDKLIMGAGEYHDDPYEYVVRLKDIKEYRAALNEFDLTQPIFKEQLKQTSETKPIGEK